MVRACTDGPVFRGDRVRWADLESASMTVALAGLTLPNPVLVAAGCGGTGRELAPYGDLAALGGFVTRSITLDARPVAPAPRIVETPSGLVNAIGLQNPGLDALPRHRAAVAGPAGGAHRSCRSPAARWGSTPSSPGGWAGRPASPGSR